ncbi:MAG: DUF2061 domain-containing protein [Alphaproteobacteria bacterium]|nr:DUF2061 domain-containing protein [Alphaproteobacteria bacterium]MBU0796866.1 DUF2061 domain-containing protein [Alphaproteobacteria bacterium]MBU0889113.1 DUF2061 domain-containing protein [Alphaproteobacteria bacterium]MBU1812147.1 DUF2061 domain-containing protein [Alphaproteobacteria bacterium]MBU2091893.1 DUF2061 domain-containing protein [Alphaproteobacteria bacterium]
MESTKRTFVKAITWQSIGLLATTLVGWLLTGSASVGGQMALATSGLALATYVLHERVWQRVSWGR